MSESLGEAQNSVGISCKLSYVPLQISINYHAIALAIVANLGERTDLETQNRI